MMASAGILVILGQLDAVAAHLVHLTHMFAVGTDDLHVLARLGQMLPLGGALLPPAAEVAFETALELTSIIVILAVQRFYQIRRASCRVRMREAVWIQVEAG